MPKMFVYNSQNPHKISQDFDNKVAVSDKRSQKSAGLLSGKLRVQTLAGPTLDRVFFLLDVNPDGVANLS